MPGTTKIERTKKPVNKETITPEIGERLLRLAYQNYRNIRLPDHVSVMIYNLVVGKCDKGHTHIMSEHSPDVGIITKDLDVYGVNITFHVDGDTLTLNRDCRPSKRVNPILFINAILEYDFVEVALYK